MCNPQKNLGTINSWKATNCMVIGALENLRLEAFWENLLCLENNDHILGAEEESL